MAEFINTIDALGDEVVLDSILDRSIIEFKDDQLTKVGDYAFYKCADLTDVDLPEVTSVGTSAFEGCNLNEFNFPKITSIGNNAFRGNASLKQVYCENMTRGSGVSSFENCTALESVDFPKLTVGVSGGFINCTSLKDVNIPLVSNIPNNMFKECTSLESIDLPSVTTFNGHTCFVCCYSLKSIRTPLVQTITNSSGTFERCASLPQLDFPKLTAINTTNAFIHCESLNRMLLRSESGVVTLQSAACFNGTPYMMGLGGKIYVPRALVSAYQTATNWSSLYALGKCEFLEVEDVTVDGSVTGELKKCTNISLNKSTLTFTNSGSQTLTATFTPALPYVDEIVWSSSDRSVAVVKDGVVTAVGNGNTTITVTCGAKSASCNVTVSGISSPVPYWSISEVTTLDGVDDYIDTGVALFEEPNDFTIIMDLSFLSKTSNNLIIACRNPFGYANGVGHGGIYMVCQNITPIVFVGYRTANGINGSWKSVKLDYWNKVSAIAIRFVAGAMDAIHYKNSSGEIVTVMPVDTPEYAKTCNTLTIGATKNMDGTVNNFYNTTINTFDIYSSALDDATIASKLQAL